MFTHTRFQWRSMPWLAVVCATELLAASAQTQVAPSSSGGEMSSATLAVQGGPHTHAMLHGAIREEGGQWVLELSGMLDGVPVQAQCPADWAQPEGPQWIGLAPFSATDAAYGISGQFAHLELFELLEGDTLGIELLIDHAFEVGPSVAESAVPIRGRPASWPAGTQSGDSEGVTECASATVILVTGAQVKAHACATVKGGTDEQASEIAKEVSQRIVQQQIAEALEELEGLLPSLWWPFPSGILWIDMDL